MVWNDPNELIWAEGSPLTAADMNDYVKDNLLALRALNVGQTIYKLNATLASNNTSFVDADANNLQVEIEISSDRLLVIAHLAVSRDASGTSYFDLIVNQDETTEVRAGDATLGLTQSPGITVREITLVGFWTGLQPGTKIVKLQLRSSNSSYAQIESAPSVVLTAFEV